MGGDDAPLSAVLGAIQAAERFGDELQVVLVGDGAAIERVRPAHELEKLGMEIVHSSESVGMGESATGSYRKKQDSSIAVANRLVSEGKVDAIVSAGNTGAVVTASLLGLSRIKGVLRPAIASIVPTVHGRSLLLDVGAVADAKPANLFQFAVMGRVYAETVQGTKKPRVGLLNIGEEREKGSDLYKQAFRLLEERAAEINFIGNVEGRDVLSGDVDVVVCDGFTGNVLLKFAESIIGVVNGTIRKELGKSLVHKFGALLMKPVFAKLKARLNYEEVGGAPLLGVNGIVVIAHGSSSPLAIRNAIHMAAAMAQERVVAKIGEELSRELLREEATG
ncbi:MAG: phosphate acyltransferase PlsX [Candidatus Eisenbacteria bacterium]|uniref:Phosphate acyltransferase n=1 Tax=Eiseniibacteriota bacterium TaxID=2212470 RepID=A0A956NA46_UNCEI|nr:phosphate acyltransferase PlsX [Candidatus Eisenbacteria bacterium]MCB9462327.1 phosphate acyltransferase PlsX [Candidatus Eisenbacteria bacterium]